MSNEPEQQIRKQEQEQPNNNELTEMDKKGVEEIVNDLLSDKNKVKAFKEQIDASNKLAIAVMDAQYYILALKNIPQKDQQIDPKAIETQIKDLSKVIIDYFTQNNIPNAVALNVLFVAMKSLLFNNKRDIKMLRLVEYTKKLIDERTQRK